MFLFPVTQECSCFVACMSWIHSRLLHFPNSTIVFVRLYVFLCIMWPYDLYWASQQHFLSSCNTYVIHMINFFRDVLILDVCEALPLWCWTIFDQPGFFICASTTWHRNFVCKIVLSWFVVKVEHKMLLKCFIIY